jgi:hypothetical protein
VRVGEEAVVAPGSSCLTCAFTRMVFAKPSAIIKFRILHGLKCTEVFLYRPANAAVKSDRADAHFLSIRRLEMLSGFL